MAWAGRATSAHDGSEEEVPEQVAEERFFRRQTTFFRPHANGFRDEAEGPQARTPEARTATAAAADHDPSGGTAHDGA